MGLDISTRCIGIAIFSNHGEPEFITHLELSKIKSIFKKTDEAEKTLLDIQKKYKIDQIIIESSLISFHRGKSSAHVIALLSKFNALVSHLCYKIWGREPLFIQATSARKVVGIAIIKGKNAKEQILQYALANFPWYVVQYKKTGKPKDFVGDELDAIVLVKYFLAKTKSPKPTPRGAQKV
jgi:hypothetical protein